VFSSPWSTCAQQISAAFAANNTLLFAGICNYALGSFPTSDTGRRWLLENVRALLDAPGEWFLDTHAAVLLYVPMPAEAAAGPAGFEVVLPVNTSVVVVEQDGLAIEGVSVSFWALDHGGRSGAAMAQSGAVEVAAATDVALVNVSVSHGGSNCVVLRPGVARVSILGCALTDCGGHGVYMDTLDNASSVLVSDNTVTGVGLVYLTQPTGILLNGGDNVSAVHNDVRNSTYTGISVAWMHGTHVPPATGAPAYRFNVSFNRVTSFGLGVMSDFGGVRIAINNADECFVNGTCYVPALVANNVISLGRHFSYGADGIYTDNAVAGVDIVSVAAGGACSRSRLHAHLHPVLPTTLCRWTIWCMMCSVLGCICTVA